MTRKELFWHRSFDRLYSWGIFASPAGTALGFRIAHHMVGLAQSRLDAERMAWKGAARC